MNNYEEVIRCSENMVKQAEAGNWDDVAKAEEQRRALLNRLFANPGSNHDVPEINRIIEKIIDINKHLEYLAISAREKTRVELERIKGGRHAVSAYSDHAAAG